MKIKLITFFLIAGAVVFTAIPVLANDEPKELLPEMSMPCKIEGTGTYFKINDSEYLNVSLESSEKITVLFESIPKTIILNIEASSVADSTQLIIGDLEVNTIYYKFEDSYKNKVIFTSDNEGEYTWTQDLTESHHVWFQPEKNDGIQSEGAQTQSESYNPIFLPEECSAYGVWDEYTSICTLTQDLSESVEITENDFTLDCNEHTITGNHTGYGIYEHAKSGIVIKNCEITNFSWGMVLIGFSNSVLSGNTITRNYSGIYLYQGFDNDIITNIIEDNQQVGFFLINSFFNNIENNQILNNSTGILLQEARNTIIHNNRIEDSGIGLVLGFGSFDNTITNNIFIKGGIYRGVFRVSEPYNNIIEDNTINNKPLVYLEDKSGQIVDNAGQVILVGCDDITIKSLELSDIVVGIQLIETVDVTIDRVKVVSTSYGIYLFDSSGNTISNSDISNSQIGIMAHDSYGNTIINNNIDSNRDGIRSYYFHNNILKNNTFSNSFVRALSLSYSSDNNLIYHNNFIDNIPQANIAESTNDFDNGYPVNFDLSLHGGNYWDDYIVAIDEYKGANQDQPGKDGIRDTSYIIYGGHAIDEDRYPFMEQDGWEALPSPTYKVAVILAEPSDVPHQASSITTEQPCKLIPEKIYLDGHNKEYFEDLAYCVTDYHLENSFGTVNLDFEIFGNGGSWFELDKCEGYYLRGKDEKIEFVVDAINLATSIGVDLSDKDIVIVLHSGEGSKKKGDKKMRSCTWAPDGHPLGCPPYKTLVAEDEMAGIWAHEIGHIIGAMIAPENTMTPDIYKMGNVEKWDLMASGSWNDDGNNPSYMSSYTKEFLQWLNYDIYPKSAYGEYWINSLETSELGDNVFRYNLSDDTNEGSKKYYILEVRNRNLKEWDSSLPGLTGKHLVLYQVDTKGFQEYEYDEKGMMWNQYRKIAIPKSGFLETNDGVLNPLINETYKDLDNLVKFTAITDRTINDKYEIKAEIEEITINSFFDKFWGVILKPKSVFEEGIKGDFVLENPSESYVLREDVNLDENQKEAERNILSSAEFYNPDFTRTKCRYSGAFAMGTIEAIKPLRKEDSNEIARRFRWSDNFPTFFAIQVKVSNISSLSSLRPVSFLQEEYSQIVYIEESLLNEKSLNVGDERWGMYGQYENCDILLRQVKTIEEFEEYKKKEKQREVERDIFSSAEFYYPFGPGIVLDDCFPSTFFSIGEIEAIKPLLKGDSHSIARGLLWPGEDEGDTPNLFALQIKDQDGHSRIVYIEESLLNKKSLKIGDEIGGFYRLEMGCDTIITSAYKVNTLKFYCFFCLFLFIISLIWLIKKILFYWKTKKIKKILIIVPLAILTVFLIYIFSILFYALFITPYLESNEITASGQKIEETVFDPVIVSAPFQASIISPDLDLHLYCDDGRHVGMNYETSEYEIDIPEAIVSGDNQGSPEWILIPPDIENCQFTVSSHDNQKFLEQNPEIAQEMEDTSDSYEIYARYIDPETDIYTSDIIAQDVNPGQEIEHQITGTDDIDIEQGILIVDIDIKPGSHPNSINLKSKGITPVAILTNEFFDAEDVIIDSVVFAGAEPLKGNLEDVDNDNDLDLILHFKTQSLQLSPDNTEAVLTAQLANESLIKGIDSVRIVSKSKSLASIVEGINESITKILQSIKKFFSQLYYLCFPSSLSPIDN